MRVGGDVKERGWVLECVCGVRMGVWVGLCRVSEWLELVCRCVELGGVVRVWV